jgi:hypothetical protein
VNKKNYWFFARDIAAILICITRITHEFTHAIKKILKMRFGIAPKKDQPQKKFYLVCEAIGTTATPDLLCQPRVIVKMNVGKQMECRLCRGNREALGENLPQSHSCPSQNST